MRSSQIFRVLGLGALVGIGGGLAAHRYLPQAPIVRGIYVGDSRAPDRGAGAWLAERREAARSRTVRFRHEDHLFETTLGAAGVTIDVAATLAAMEAVGHKGSFSSRFHESERARKGLVDLPLVWTVDEAKARALIATFAESLERKPVDAKLDLVKHLKIPEIAGQSLDVDASLASLKSSAHDDDELVSLIVHRVAAKVSVDDVSRVDIEKVVSAYETAFVTWGVGANRAINIATAVSHFDGTVLAPGESFSFNDKVGPRTRERGFALAPEIQGDELQNGYGGGTCQSSSTLHAAALFAALDITERQAHSRPSAYTKMGLDATVSFPLADLKFKNSLPYSIMIHAYFPRPTALRVEILGGDPVAKVDYTYGVSHAEDFVRRVTVKSNLAPGTRIRHQKGIPGYDVFSMVKVTYNDGRTSERKYYSGYRPAPEVFWVAPGYDSGELPPLPEHAKGVEGAPGSGEPAPPDSPTLAASTTLGG
ncbi:MAG: VanW family protein [Byssovorax sp.]